LATPNYHGVAWMLIKHKKDGQMGLKYVDSISVFPGSYGNVRVWNLYAHIAEWIGQS
jgi:hypothetical protein